jgi:hypothetical protein
LKYVQTATQQQQQLQLWEGLSAARSARLWVELVPQVVQLQGIAAVNVVVTGMLGLAQLSSLHFAKRSARLVRM